jgi:hypothetical protein
MTRTLRSRHAEDVGGVIVEPGQAIPDSADPDVVERLHARGLVTSDKPKTDTPTKSKRSSSRSSSSEQE